MEPSETPDVVPKPTEKTVPKNKKAVIIPLEYWKINPPLHQIESEINEAIWQSAKEKDKENERIRLFEQEKLRRKAVVEAKKAEKLKEKMKEKGLKEIKKKSLKSGDPKEIEKEKLEKLKACRKRFYEKKRLKKLEEDEKRKEEREILLRNYVVPSDTA